MKIERLEKFSLVILLLGLSSGSAFYIINPLIKPTFILPLIAFFMLSLSKSYFIDKLNILILMLAFLALFFNSLYPTENNTLDIYFILLLYLLYIVANIAAKQYRMSDDRIVFIVVTIIALIYGLYIYEVNSGVMLIEKQSNEEGLYSATFNNPNDLPAFIVSFSILLLFLVDKKYKSITTTLIIYLALLYLIFSLGSRIALLIFISIPILYFLLVKNKIIIPLVIATTIILIATVDWEYQLQYLANSEIDTISRSASRMLLILNDYDEDKSANYRIESYFYAIQNIDQTIFGVGTKNYETFYGHTFLGTVVTSNPHSFFIEITIAFGWAGLATLTAITFFLFKSYFSLRSNERFAAFSSLLIFIIITFLPSTIIRLPILFFPIFFFYCLSVKK